LTCAPGLSAKRRIFDLRARVLGQTVRNRPFGGAGGDMGLGAAKIGAAFEPKGELFDRARNAIPPDWPVGAMLGSRDDHAGRCRASRAGGRIGTKTLVPVEKRGRRCSVLREKICENRPLRSPRSTTITAPSILFPTNAPS